jgi:hypothetical protein
MDEEAVRKISEVSTAAFKELFAKLPKRVDVFLRDYAPTPLRAKIAEVTRYAWNTHPFANLIVIGPRNPEKYHIEAKQIAEELAHTPIYVVSDNDVLPIGKDFLSRGVAILEAHPDYGILSATSISDGHYPARVLDSAAEVEQMHSVGGIVFVRKGILTEFNDCRPDEVDDVICSEMNRKGYRTGVMPSVRFNHLGCGYSIYQRFAEKGTP